MDKASATTTEDLSLIPGRVKPKTINSIQLAFIFVQKDTLQNKYSKVRSKIEQQQKDTE